jgi:hypothetical protein
VVPRKAGAWIATALLAACGGGGDDAPPAGTPAATPEIPAVVQDTTIPQQDTTDTQLEREAFAYRGAGRDPFMSLLRSGDVRPLPQDLRVRAINFDPRYPQRSVVTIQDTTSDRRYTLRIGDQVGRVRITQIRETEVVITIEEFGVERQVVLPIRRLREDSR